MKLSKDEKKKVTIERKKIRENKQKNLLFFEELFKKEEKK